MKQRITQLIFATLVLIAIIFLTTYKLPYYIYQPGNASPLNPMIDIEGSQNSKGDMHLVTVRGGQATPIYYLWAKLKPFYQIYPLEEIRPEGISQEEYNHIQIEYMESSQDQAIAVAFKAANKEVQYEFDGVFVSYVDDEMPAAQVLQGGDEILSVDGQLVEQTEDLSQYVGSLDVNETVHLTLLRNGSEVEVDVGLATFPENPDKVGMGVGLVTKRNVVTEPEVIFNSGEIGGPSAGLMFSLEIFDRITPVDYTKGYQICGTGTIDGDGIVGRIGGIDKKVVASDQDGCDVFFAPNEEGAIESNYSVASQTAKEIETDMVVVPIDTFDEAVDYLEKLQPKSA
ncbi:PDZ domain-containing protein [Salirhabdus euzebyi]|uniref:PDZ domain-containing protein n=1 Tax=Salirhabdus euzebyi TaxID=394506 RepID=A0A841Q946_9BACI|nr:SepM family pheromone-processing serine protease [Salirhabdus euzebyi]MBB6455011.1 PDZ domain-containing protein [Salirhabdus euzebyi]